MLMIVVERHAVALMAGKWENTGLEERISLEAAGVLLILALAGTIHGAIGFGSGLVAVGLLSLVINIKDATLILVTTSICLNAYIFLKLRKHFRWSRVWVLYVSTIPGAILGVEVLVNADPHLLELLLGGILLVACVQALIPRLAAKPWHPVYLGIPCGLFAGGLQGALATCCCQPMPSAELQTSL